MHMRKIELAKRKARLERSLEMRRKMVVVAMAMALTMLLASMSLGQDDPADAPPAMRVAALSASVENACPYTETIIDAPGMQEYRWWDGDFCWTHTLSVPDGMTLIMATLAIEAYDVDNPGPADPELDVISADATPLGVLTGAGGTNSTTTFNVPPASLVDGQVDVCIDIDSTHNVNWWGVTVKSSTLSTAWISPSQDVLWPPNHKMVEVEVLVASCDPVPTCNIVRVESNEPLDGAGDGSTEPDWEITGPLTVDLRAERSGPLTGRVYTIVVECNGAEASVEVTVPHDQGKGKK